MLNQKEDKISLLGSIAFILLFFLFISAFPDKQEPANNNPFQQEQISTLHATSLKALIVEDISIPSFETSWTSLPYGKLFNHTAGFTGIFVNNKNTSIEISFLQKDNPQVSFSFCRFYYHLFPKNSDELPVLS